MDNLDAQSHAQPRVGDVIAGKYRLDRIVGAGGMGMVFAATHMELDRLVAVKFVHGSYCQNPEVIARFLREARAVVRIESEHVAKVIDVGHAEGGTPYMVMEYLDGEDLSDLLKLGPVAVPDAVDYVIQACAAMQEAHEMGIVHRDLKPANLFLTHRRDRTPLVKVLDFGISKLNDPEPTHAALTNPAMLMGSPAYMSPEQLTNPREVDPRTDLWSLGVILFELLAGRPAFQAQSLPLLMTAIMQQAPDDLVQLRPDVPPGLASVVARCLEKTVERRFQNVTELVTALLPFAPRRSHWSIERIAKSGSAHSLRHIAEQANLTLGSHGNPVIAAREPGPAREGTRGEWSRNSEPAPSQIRWLWPAVALGGVVVLGLALWFVVGRSKDTEQPLATAASSTEAEAPRASAASAPVAVPAATPPAVTSAAPVGAIEANAGSPESSAAPSVLSPPDKVPVVRARPTPHPVARPTPEPAPRESPPSERGRPTPAAPRNPLQMDIK